MGKLSRTSRGGSPVIQFSYNSGILMPNCKNDHPSRFGHPGNACPGLPCRGDHRPEAVRQDNTGEGTVPRQALRLTGRPGHAGLRRRRPPRLSGTLRQRRRDRRSPTLPGLVFLPADAGGSRRPNGSVRVDGLAAIRASVPHHADSRGSGRSGPVTAFFTARVARRSRADRQHRRIVVARAVPADSRPRAGARAVVRQLRDDLSGTRPSPDHRTAQPEPFSAIPEAVCGPLRPVAQHVKPGQ